MSCIEKIDRYIIPNTIIVKLSQIYSYIGKKDYFLKETKPNIGKIIEDTVERDAYFISKMIGQDIKDSRMRLIISKDSSPRTKEEVILFNLKQKLSNIQFFASDIELSSSKLLSIIKEITEKENIDYISPEISEKLNNWLHIISSHIQNYDYEPIYLYLHFIIDLFNLAPLTEFNDLLTYIALYIVLLKANIASIKFISLYECINTNLDSFKSLLSDCTFNWKEGHANTNEFINYMLDILLDASKKCESFVNNYTDEINSNKTDSIVNTIYNLPRTFTKDDIRAYHPYVSESTINRVLMKLRDDDLIKPSGMGRSACWIKTKML